MLRAPRNVKGRTKVLTCLDATTSAAQELPERELRPRALEWTSGLSVGGQRGVVEALSFLLVA